MQNNAKHLNGFDFMVKCHMISTVFLRFVRVSVFLWSCDSVGLVVSAGLQFHVSSRLRHSLVPMEQTPLDSMGDHVMSESPSSWVHAQSNPRSSVFCRSSHRWILVAMMSFPVGDLVMMTVIQTSRFTRSWCFMCSFIFRLSSDHSGQMHIQLDPNKNMQNLETQVLFYLFDFEALDDCSCLNVFCLNRCSRKNGVKLLLDWTGFEVLKWPALTIITIIITTTTVNTNFRIFVFSLFDCWMKLWQCYWMVPGVWMVMVKVLNCICMFESRVYLTRNIWMISSSLWDRLNWMWIICLLTLYNTASSVSWCIG